MRSLTFKQGRNGAENVLGGISEKSVKYISTEQELALVVEIYIYIYLKSDLRTTLPLPKVSTSSSSPYSSFPIP
jgi:hypothetical protein